VKTQDRPEVVDTLGRPRVLIVGDVILDRYVSGEVSRISPEAPIPVLAARHVEDRLGGAGNVAANLRAMEAEVEVIGMMGDDANGRRVTELLDAIGVRSHRCVRDASRPTIEKARVISGVQQMLRIDWEEPDPMGEAYEAQVVRSISEALEGVGAVILSDYGKGVLTRRLIGAIIEQARVRDVPVLVDPKGVDYTRYRGATLITPNRREAEEAIGHAISSLDDLPEVGRKLIALSELEAAVITLGADGIFFLTKDGRSDRVPTVARAVFDVTGAGDTVIAHLALGLAAGLKLAQTVHLANAAAGIVVGRRGAASVTRGELKAALGGPMPVGKVLSPEDVKPLVSEWRAEGKRVVFTNGCFDVLHAGHVAYLRFARSQGDALLVGVNDDASVRRLKGEGRPVNDIEDRLIVLAALEMVDAVVPFPEDTPARIVEDVSPDILVKGEDWRDKGVVGRDWVEQHGGKVVLAPMLEGRSTSAILERGRRDGA
jgi:D-beta-D-heptose 7-phosphate kinase/D-beta-D-heptose 1-phosphate adenosyltransferase